MFELLGNETEHEAAVKRIINLQKQIIQNYDEINLKADITETQKKKPTTK